MIFGVWVWYCLLKTFLAQEYSYSPILSSNIYVLHLYIAILCVYEILLVHGLKDRCSLFCFTIYQCILQFVLVSVFTDTLHLFDLCNVSWLLSQVCAGWNLKSVYHTPIPILLEFCLGLQWIYGLICAEFIGLKYINSSEAEIQNLSPPCQVFFDFSCKVFFFPSKVIPIIADI